MNASEPAVRADGLCARPGCSSPLPRSRQLRKYAGAALDSDPFCSTVCCKLYYGLAAHAKAPGPAKGWQDPEVVARRKEQQRDLRRGRYRGVAAAKGFGA